MNRKSEQPFKTICPEKLHSVQGLQALRPKGLDLPYSSPEPTLQQPYAINTPDSRTKPAESPESEDRQSEGPSWSSPGTPLHPRKRQRIANEDGFPVGPDDMRVGQDLTLHGRTYHISSSTAWLRRFETASCWIAVYIAKVAGYRIEGDEQIKRIQFTAPPECCEGLFRLDSFGPLWVQPEGDGKPQPETTLKQPETYSHPGVDGT